MNLTNKEDITDTEKKINMMNADDILGVQNLVALTQTQQEKSWLPSTYESRKIEDDNLSVASSTHFTVIGMPVSSNPKKTCCGITKLILTMSLVFFLGISAAVFMFEVRMHQRFQ